MKPRLAEAEPLVDSEARTVADTRMPSPQAGRHGLVVDVLSAVWSRRGMFALVLAVAFGAALLLITFLPTRFTASAVIAMETTRSPAPTTDAPLNAVIDIAVIESQFEVLRSENVWRGVIDRLGLERDPEFGELKPTLLERLRAILPTRTASTEGIEDTRLNRTITALRQSLKLVRVGRSYIAEIMVTTGDPRRAAAIANALAEGYISDRLSAKAQLLQQASTWMQQRLDELRKQAGEAARAVDTFRSENGAASREGLVRLRDLEATSQAYKSIYETFLNRYNQTVQQQSSPVTEARVLTEARAPIAPSSPNAPLILVLSLLTGGLAGGVAAFAREKLDRRLRSALQIREQLDLRCLAVLPLVQGRRSRIRAEGAGWVTSMGNRASLCRIDQGAAGKDQAEVAVRRLRLAIDQDNVTGKGLRIAITSAIRGEGKSTLSLNLALAMVHAGKRVLLVDGDLRNPAITSIIAPTSEFGLIEAMENPTILAKSATADYCGIRLLGEQRLVGRQPGAALPHSVDVLSSAPFRKLLASARNAFDYVLIDLPALSDGLEAGVVADAADLVVLVAEWGRTTTEDIERGLTTSGAVANRVLGVVLNQVPPAALQRAGSVAA